MKKRGQVAANTKYSLAGKFKKSQVAMEYIMILSLVLMILIPTIYVFREYVMESGDEITINNINRISNTMLETSIEMFYLGAPSKIVIDLEMPEKVEAMWLMDNGNAKNANHEYFLMFKLNLQDGPQDFYFQSDIPVKCLECKIDTALIDQCGVNEFRCYKFPEDDYSPGKKHFKIEAADCQEIGLCVFIGEISTIVKEGIGEVSTCECSSGTCCDGCNYRASSTQCRASTGICDIAEYCTGSSATCPLNTYKSSGTSCGTNIECDGSGNCVTTLKANGQLCNLASECSSGFCADGVCCNNACTTTCKSCNIAGSVGTCSNDAVGTSCGTGQQCDASGNCVSTLKANGQPCSTGTQCQSTYCVDGFCCDTSCTGTCKACNIAEIWGTCSNEPAGTSCGTGQQCDAGGNCVKANGQSCTLGTQCYSGNCVDGYCCDTSCTGTCKACNIAGKLGTCSNIPNQEDPANECGGASCCGYCNGAGACTNVASGSTCSSPGTTCTATHYRCDGSGSCTAPTNPAQCVSYYGSFTCNWLCAYKIAGGLCGGSYAYDASCITQSHACDQYSNRPGGTENSCLCFTYVY